MRIQIIIAILLVLVLFVIMNSVRKQKIDFRHALSWIIYIVIMLLFDIFPQLVQWVSDIVGIELPINMLFFFGVSIAFLLIYSLTMTVSNLTEKVKKLTQEVALLEKKLEERTETKESE